jgi:hypothetical protein
METVFGAAPRVSQIVIGLRFAQNASEVHSRKQRRSPPALRQVLPDGHQSRPSQRALHPKPGRHWLL